MIQDSGFQILKIPGFCDFSDLLSIRANPFLIACIWNLESGIRNQLAFGLGDIDG